MSAGAADPTPARRLTVLAGPTAVGKGTIAAYVRAHFPQVWLSVSMTTRKPRPGEVDGVHYHFVDEAEFDRLVDAGQFLEHATVHGAVSYTHLDVYKRQPHPRAGSGVLPRGARGCRAGVGRPA